MEDGTNNLWNTPEAESWCRNFGYEEYLNMHARMECMGKVLSELGYEAICEVFNDEMHRDMGDANEIPIQS